jgi:predicted small lipoprotein YifL
MTRSLALLLACALLLAACGRKNPPEIPQDAGPAWTTERVSGEYGGGFQVDADERRRIAPPPPAYFPGAAETPQRQVTPGILTFPMPDQ